jgi:DNA-binding transcriptional regulator YdaS (Cro superfamily)
MTKSLDLAAMRKIITEKIDRFGGQTAWANRHGISVAYVNDIVMGRKSISPRVARMIGYERRTIYQRRNAKGA